MITKAMILEALQGKGYLSENDIYCLCNHRRQDGRYPFIMLERQGLIHSTHKPSSDGKQVKHYALGAAPHEKIKIEPAALPLHDYEEFGINPPVKKIDYRSLSPEELLRLVNNA